MQEETDMSEHPAHLDRSPPEELLEHPLAEELLGWRLPRTPDEVPRLAELAERLRDSRLDGRLVDALTRFQRPHYVRRTLARTPACELLLVCWLPGQGSRVHDHGGSYGASLVLRGELEETRFAWTDTRLAPSALASARPGDVLLEQQETIHRMDNRSGRGAVTLHLYAPPMSGMTNYEVEVGGPGATASSGAPSRTPPWPP